MFNLQAGEAVTVQLRDQDSPVVERATVTEVFEGQHRMGGRDFDLFAFSVNGFTFTLEPDTFVTKHTTREA